jgi:AbrB family looped-hinge helix DNA binding protein
MSTTSPTKRLKPERVRLDQAGRIVLPARFRKSLRLSPGDAVTVTLDKDKLQISTSKSALDKAQQIMRQKNPARRSAVAALIAERRTEAARE